MQVVGFYTHLQQAFVETDHDFEAVVHVPEQHGLVDQREAGIQQAPAGRGGLRRQFRRMDEMQAQPQRPVFSQHADQRRGDALRQRRGHFRADPDQFHMWNGPEGFQDRFQPCIAECQGIAAGNKNIANGRVSTKPGEGLGGGGGGLPGGPRPGAIAAEAGTIARGEQQGLARVGPDQARRDLMGGFAQRV